MRQTKTLANSLINWYRKNARDLPWRHTTDPYKIWLSEIILQQTTIAQGTSYYLKFLDHFPTIQDLANSELDAVLKLWEGLGYYSRARNLHFTAQHIVYELDGQFPETYDQLIKLKGVGPYTAAAISSFCFNEAKVVVDGNVIRVISRLYGIKEAVDIPSTLLVIKQKAQALLETQEPAEFNQTIMEFGAINCTYKNPNCEACPLSKSCLAYTKSLVAEIPLKSKKIKKRTRYFHYFIFENKAQKVLVQQRAEKDIWLGLYQFPLIENESKEPLQRTPESISASKFELLSVSKEYKQLLTHQKIISRYYHYKVVNIKSTLYKSIPINSLSKLAWPKSINTYLLDKNF